MKTNLFISDIVQLIGQYLDNYKDVKALRHTCLISYYLKYDILLDSFNRKGNYSDYNVVGLSHKTLYEIGFFTTAILNSVKYINVNKPSDHLGLYKIKIKSDFDDDEEDDIHINYLSFMESKVTLKNLEKIKIDLNFTPKIFNNIEELYRDNKRFKKNKIKLEFSDDRIRYHYEIFEALHKNKICKMIMINYYPVIGYTEDDEMNYEIRHICYRYKKFDYPYIEICLQIPVFLGRGYDFINFRIDVLTHKTLYFSNCKDLDISHLFDHIKKPQLPQVPKPIIPPPPQVPHQSRETRENKIKDIVLNNLDLPKDKSVYEIVFKDFKGLKLLCVQEGKGYARSLYTMNLSTKRPTGNSPNKTDLSDLLKDI